MLSALVCFFSPVGLLNGKLADVVVDSLLAKGSTLEKADIVERSRVVIRGGVRLTPISYNVLHQFYSSHGCAAVEFFDLLGVGVHKEIVQVVSGAGFVVVSQVGVLV